ncbi:hypothetical protein [Helicobacter trogontum]|uniref:hypothetical protein n=1 Tax=Helicobacter trogontum TaxID=50960 RepID=UPI00131A1178|nr:hypothetical protein [Helicobacter trogontum]
MVKNNIESNAVRYITEVLQEQLIMRKNKKRGGATVMAQNTTLMQTANTTYKAQQTILL